MCTKTWEAGTWKDSADRETAIKLPTRRYLTPAKLHTIYPAVSPHCFCGCPESGSFLYVFWSCKHPKPIWQQAAARASKIAGHLFTLTIQMCIFFLPSQMFPFHVKDWHAHFLVPFIGWLPWIGVPPLYPSHRFWPGGETIKLSECIHHTLYDTIHLFDRKSEPWDIPFW